MLNIKLCVRSCVWSDPKCDAFMFGLVVGHTIIPWCPLLREKITPKEIPYDTSPFSSDRELRQSRGNNSSSTTTSSYNRFTRYWSGTHGSLAIKSSYEWTLGCHRRSNDKRKIAYASIQSLNICDGSLPGLGKIQAYEVRWTTFPPQLKTDDPVREE